MSGALDYESFAAITKSPLHSTQVYVNAPMDMDGYAVPVNSEREGTASCFIYL